MALALPQRIALQQGLELLDQCRFEEGRDHLSALGRDHTTSPPARLFHGIACWDCGDFVQAEAEFQAAHALDPANVLAISYLALVKAALGDWASARRFWQPHGHHTNRGYRVRVTEWIEEQFLRANGWPDHLPGKSPGPEIVTELPPEEYTPLDGSEEVAEQLTRPRVDWVPGLYGFAGNTAEALLTVSAKRLGYLQHSFLKRAMFRAMQRCRFEDIVTGIAPLLGDPRCDMVVVWLAATSAELTGQARVAATLCESVEPMEDWPDAFRAVYARSLYRLGRHEECTEHLTKIAVRGPEDYGVHWTLGCLALAQQDRTQARTLFLRAHTAYMVDTLENQWWAVERALAHKAMSVTSA